MLQLNVGYSAPDAAATCAIASVDGSIIDFVLSTATETDPNVLIPDAAHSGARLLAGQNGHDKLLVTMPSVEHDNTLPEQIAEQATCIPAETTVESTPAAFPSALARGYLDGMHSGALIDAITEPVKVYTDASMQEGRPTTAGMILIDDDNYIVTFGMRELHGVSDIADAELRAGLLGLEVALELGINTAEWVSDNQIAQGAVTGTTDWDTEAATTLRSTIATFDTCGVTDIRGRDNILADALAADARHETVAQPAVYTAPPITAELLATYGRTLPPTTQPTPSHSD